MADVSMKIKAAEDAAAPRYFRCSPAGQPVSILLRLEMIERLAAEVLDSFRAVTARGSEIGGILLGRCDPGAPRVVVVDDYELVPCGYQRGPLYQLTGDEESGLRKSMETRRQGARHAVGLFRSHTRRALALDADDLALFEEHFRGGNDVFLLVRPFVKQATVGCLFVRDNGTVSGGEETFPFDVAELLKPAFAAQTGEAPPRPPEPRPPAPVIQITEAKAERESVAAPPAAEPAEQARAERESAAPRRNWWLAAAAGGVLALAAAGWFLARPHRGPAPIQPAAVPMLRAERGAGQILLTWDRDAAWARTARGATLSIFDGAQKEDVPLDFNQLRAGSIGYLPVTNDVSFRMEVTDGKSGKTMAESLRVLGTRPSPMPVEAPGDAGAKPPAPAAPAAPPITAPVPETTPPSSAPLRFTPPGTLAARLRPAEPTELPEPPPIPEQAGAASVPAGLGAVRAPALPEPKPAAPPPAAPAAASPRVTSAPIPAQLIRRRDPIYPVLARQARVSGTVRLQLTIGTDGRVRGVTPVEGPSLLRQAAVEAVRQWLFTPSRLNGAPVESTTVVEINFSLAR